MRVGDYVRVIATGDICKVVAVGCADHVTVRICGELRTLHVNELEVVTR